MRSVKRKIVRNYAIFFDIMRYYAKIMRYFLVYGGTKPIPGRDLSLVLERAGGALVAQLDSGPRGVRVGDCGGREG